MGFMATSSGFLPTAPNGFHVFVSALSYPVRPFVSLPSAGTFGRVRLVMHRRTNRVFALKILQKAQVVALKQQGSILNERALLWRVDHPFITKLYDTYRDRDRLYMLLELVQGGELFSRLQNAAAPGRIGVDEARFYAACVLDALDYMHAQDILYR